MSATAPDPVEPQTAAGVEGAPAPVPPRRVRWGRWALGIAVAVVAVLALAVLGGRVWLRGDGGRAFLMRTLEGRELGPVGNLHLEGLTGDPLGAFAVRRLTIADATGVWLDARDLAVSWRPGELVQRRVHLVTVRAADMVVLRRPVLKVRPPTPPKPSPVGVVLDDLKLRLETRPEASMTPGDWDVQGRFAYDRAGQGNTAVTVASRLHRGDGAAFDVAFGGKGELKLRVQAQEAAGGALAGSMGLPTGQTFVLKATADGTAAGGRFALRTRSGNTSPADGDGTWSPEGARLNGRVTLAASRVLSPYVARIGPEARVAIVSRSLTDGTSDLDARMDGAFAHFKATGPARLSDRTTPGVKVELQVSDLSRWNHLATVGPTRAVGVIKGRPDRFTYTGRIAGDRLTLGTAYALAHAEGPATMSLDKGVVHVTGDLQGAGGSGKGLIPTLLGARPRVQADVSMLAHGRLSLKSIHIAGANLKVDGSGGQGLLGGLNFKGAAQVASVAGARPGAAGGLDAQWTADETKGRDGRAAWRFSFDAKGRGLKTGLAEADRLLGPTARLAAKGVWADGAVALSGVELTGEAASATGSGGLGAKGELTTDFDWKAKGPFAAGPVEIAGEARGHGKVTGELSKPQADLTADLTSLDFGKLVIRPAHLALTFASGPSGVEGRLALKGPSEYGEATARTAFHFADGGLALSDLFADAGGVKLSGAVTLRNGAPSTADLTVAAGKGAFLGSGTVTGGLKLSARPGGGGVIAQAALEGRNVSPLDSAISVHAISLKADGPLERLPFKVSVEAQTPTPYRFAGDGVFEGSQAIKTLTLSGTGKLRKTDVKTLEPLTVRFGPTERSLHARIAAAGGRIEADARDVGGAVTGKATLTDVSLTELNADFAGVVQAVVTLDGKGPRLNGRMEADVVDARAREAPVALGLDAKVVATLADTRIRLLAQATNDQGLMSRLDADLPAEAAASPFRIAVDRTKAVRGTFSADGELRPLWDLLVGGDRTLSGRVATQGTVAGTLNDLQISGDASVSKGRFQDAPTGLVLQDLEVKARFARNVVDISRFSGADVKGGTVTGDGQISLQRDGGSNFALTLSKFRLIDNTLARGTASGSVKVVRDAEGHAKLSGTLVVDRADVSAKPLKPTGVTPLDVIEVNLPVKEGEDPANAKRPGPLQVALDVTLQAPRGVFVRGNGLDAELSLTAHVGGSTSQPDLSGVARVVRGSYDFSGKRFDFDEAGTVRLGATAEAIRLDLTARRDDPALNAIVRITGTAARPRITLTSTPVLPQDEVLSRVLFGVSASQLSPFEAAGLASALAGLASGGGFDILGGLRQFAGLDRLAIGGTAGGATVTGGKYITDNIYLELTGAGAQRTTTTTDPGRTGSSASVEWRVRRNLSLVSQVWTGGDTRLSVRFRKDY